MLIYQLVRIKYALDTNAYVHICVCVRASVCIWVTAPHTQPLCTCFDSVTVAQSVLASYQCVLIGSVTSNQQYFCSSIGHSRLSGLSASGVVLAFQSMLWLLWGWGRGDDYSKLNAQSVFKTSSDSTWYWFCISRMQLLSSLLHKQSAV